jgi:hypothetical protein
MNAQTKTETKAKRLTPEELKAVAGITEQDMEDFYSGWASVNLSLFNNEDPKREDERTLLRIWDKIKAHVPSPPEEVLQKIERIRQRVAQDDLRAAFKEGE